jgi:hypothetical protein
MLFDIGDQRQMIQQVFHVTKSEIYHYHGRYALLVTIVHTDIF